MFFAGTPSLVTARIGTVATSETGVKSLSGSHDSLSNKAGAAANEVAAISSV